LYLNRTIEYVTASGWLTATLLPTMAPATLRLAATVGMLKTGTYQALVHVSGDGASNSPQIVTVTFTVTS
jgi:hypothetical protein